jgi:hypothetical protein
VDELRAARSAARPVAGSVAEGRRVVTDAARPAHRAHAARKAPALAAQALTCCRRLAARGGSISLTSFINGPQYAPERASHPFRSATSSSSETVS